MYSETNAEVSHIQRLIVCAGLQLQVHRQVLQSISQALASSLLPQPAAGLLQAGVIIEPVFA